MCTNSIAQIQMEASTRDEKCDEFSSLGLEKDLGVKSDNTATWTPEETKLKFNFTRESADRWWNVESASESHPDSIPFRFAGLPRPFTYLRHARSTLESSRVLVQSQHPSGFMQVALRFCSSIGVTPMQFGISGVKRPHWYFWHMRRDVSGAKIHQTTGNVDSRSSSR